MTKLDTDTLQHIGDQLGKLSEQLTEAAAGEEPASWFVVGVVAAAITTLSEVLKDAE